MKTSQLQLWGFDGRQAPVDLLERASRGGVTGISLFRHFNVDSASQIHDLTGSLTDAAGRDDLLIAIDQEGGQLRAVAGSTPFAGNLALGAVDDLDLTRRVASAIGDELRAVGVTVNYAPVADVMTQPNNPSLGVRSFGSDPAIVGGHVAAFVEGLRSASVLSVLKHFPGKGEAAVDPHHALPVLELTADRLHDVELVPFKRGVQSGADAVMVGHYALPQITGREDLPASVSDVIVTGLLREQIGFDGLVITDALDMKALAQGQASVIEALAAVRAGADLLLSTADYDRAVALDDGLHHAANRGVIDAAHIDQSVERLRRARLLTAREDVPELSIVGGRAHMALAGELASRSITVLRDGGDVLPLARDAQIVTIMVQPVDLTPAETSSYDGADLLDAARRVFPNVKGMVVAPDPSANEIAAAAALAAGADAVILGTITATATQGHLATALSSVAPLVTVALRTPFDLAHYPWATTHLCTYSVLRPSLDALVDVLAGAPAPGKLPVNIQGLHDRGCGLTGRR